MNFISWVIGQNEVFGRSFPAFRFVATDRSGIIRPNNLSFFTKFWHFFIEELEDFDGHTKIAFNSNQNQVSTDGWSSRVIMTQVRRKSRTCKYCRIWDYSLRKKISDRLHCQEDRKRYFVVHKNQHQMNIKMNLRVFLLNCSTPHYRQAKFIYENKVWLIYCES